MNRTSLNITIQTTILLVICPLFLWAQIDRKALSKYFDTSGQIEFSYQQSTLKGDYQLMPPNFFRIQGSTSISIMDMPFRIDGFWSTEQSPLRQNMNYFHCTIDHQELIKNIRKKIEERAKEKTKHLQKQLRIPEKLPDKKTLEAMGKQKLDSMKQEQVKQAKNKKILKKQMKKNEKKQKKLEKKKKKLEKKYKKNKEKLEKNKKKAEKWKQKGDSLMTRKDQLQDSVLENKWVKKARNYEEEQAAIKQQFQDSITKYKDKQKELKDKWTSSDQYEQRLSKKRNEMEEKLEQELSHYDPYVQKYESTKEKVFLYRDKINQLKDAKNMAKDSLQNIDIEKADSLKLISKMEKILLNVKAFQIGTSFPFYSKLSINAVPVTGLHVEYAPKQLYFAATGSKNLNAVDPAAQVNLPNQQNQTLSSTFSRDLVAAAFGYGLQEENHVHLNLVYGLDDATSIQQDTFQTLQRHVLPKENFVLSTDFKTTLPTHTFIQIEGELAYAMLANNTNEKRIDFKEVEQFVKLNTRFTEEFLSDFALQLTPTWKPVEELEFQMNYERVSSGFRSLGTPFLRKDHETISLNYQHHLMKKQLMLRTFVLTDRTNLNGFLPISVYNQQLGSEVALLFEKYPKITAGAAFTATTHDYIQDTSLKNNFFLQQYHLGIAQDYELLKMKHRATIQTTMQLNEGDNPNLEFQHFGIQCTQETEINAQFTMALMMAYSQQIMLLLENRLLSFGLSGKASVLKKCQLTGTSSYTLNFDTGHKLENVVQLTYPITKFMSLTGRATHTLYQLSTTSLHAFAGFGGLTVRW